MSSAKLAESSQGGTMKTLQWYGKEDVRVVDAPIPGVKDGTDAVIKVTLSTVCGSDLHMYTGDLNASMKGDIMGHESMGIVQQVGPDVKNLKVGDRVVVSFDIAEGNCMYCKKELYTCCDLTNNSKMMEKLYGHRIAGAFGYTHLTGGYPGAQAEYLRVPYADVNCLKIPDGIPDEKVLFLSDIVCTGWHANELANVQKGDVVCIWGAGPVGLMAAALAKFRGASRVLIVDKDEERLEMARNKIGCEIINFDKVDVVKRFQELVPNGPDCCIEAAGFRFAKSIVHKVERALNLEGDTPELLAEIIKIIRKGGYIGVIADYFYHANHFPIGAFMEKSLHMAGGQSPCQKYWKKLLEYIVTGQFDPTFLVTHEFPLTEGDKAYKMFNKHEDGMVKIFLRPGGELKDMRKIANDIKPMRNMA